MSSPGSGGPHLRPQTHALSTLPTELFPHLPPFSLSIDGHLGGCQNLQYYNIDVWQQFLQLNYNNSRPCVKEHGVGIHHPRSLSYLFMVNAWVWVCDCKWWAVSVWLSALSMESAASPSWRTVWQSDHIASNPITSEESQSAFQPWTLREIALGKCCVWTNTLKSVVFFLLYIFF